MSDVYTLLRKRLEEFAIPIVPGKGILEFLTIIFSEKEAEMLSKFKSFNKFYSIDEFAYKNGYNPRIVRDIFHSLARRSLIRYRKERDKELFCIQPLVIGIHEAFFSSWRVQDPNILIPAAQAMQEYFDDIFHKMASNSRSPWARIIPSLNAMKTIITDQYDYDDKLEIQITLRDRIRRFAILIKYGGRNLLKKLFKGQIGDLLDSLRSDGFYVLKRIPEIIGLKSNEINTFPRKQKSYHKQKVIKIDEKLSIILKIYPYEIIKYYIEKATKVSVTPCPCRKANRLLDECVDEMQKVGCKFPVEDTCIHLQYDDKELNKYNLRGGHIISKEEAFSILDRCEKAGLVHSSFNSMEKVEFICNCCPCCCGILGTMTKYHQKYRAFVESNFQPMILNIKCVKCSNCKKMCPVNAISQDENGFPKINLKICIGCGVCVTNCSENALKLIKVKDIRPAIDAIEAYMNFANEKLSNDK